MRIKNNGIPEEFKKYVHNGESTIDELRDYVQMVIDETTNAIKYADEVFSVIHPHLDSPIIQNNVEFDTEYGTYTYYELLQYLKTNVDKADTLHSKAVSLLQQLADIENTDDGILDEQLFNDVMKAFTDLQERYLAWEL